MPNSSKYRIYQSFFFFSFLPSAGIIGIRPHSLAGFTKVKCQGTYSVQLIWSFTLLLVSCVYKWHLNQESVWKIKLKLEQNWTWPSASTQSPVNKSFSPLHMLSYFRTDACSVCLDVISFLSLSFSRKYKKTLFPDFCYHIPKVYEHLICSFLT